MSLMHRVFAGGAPADLDTSLEHFVDDFCNWLDACFDNKLLPPASIFAFTASFKSNSYLAELFPHMATVRQAFGECARNADWHTEYLSAFAVIGNKWQDRSDTLFSDADLEKADRNDVLGCCYSPGLTVHCVSVEAPSRQPRGKQLVGFTELDLTFGSADCSGAATQFRYETTPVEAAALVADGVYAEGLTSAQCIRNSITGYVDTYRGTGADGSLSDKFFSYVKQVCGKKTNDTTANSRTPGAPQKPILGDLVRWTTQHWALCVGLLEHVYALFGGSASELGDLLALFCAHLVHGGAARQPQSAKEATEERHNEVVALKENAMFLLQYVSQYFARRMTVVRDGSASELSSVSGEFPREAWMRLVARTLTACRGNVCTLQHTTVTQTERKPDYDKIRKEALQKTRAVLGKVTNFADFERGSTPAKATVPSAGVDASTIEATPAHFERILLNSIISYFILKHIKDPTLLASERCWPEADVAELSTMFTAYTAIMWKQLNDVKLSGCEWVNGKSVHFSIAICHLAMTVLASTEMRDEFPDLAGFTLVPYRTVWHKLLQRASVSSTSLKTIVQYLHVLLERESTKKHFMYEPHDAICQLAKSYSSSHEKFHKDWAVRRSEETRKRYAENEERICELTDYVEADYDDYDDDERPTRNQLKKARQRLNQCRNASYKVQILPFHTRIQALVWDLPEKLLASLTVSEKCLLYLTGMSYATEDKGCILHGIDANLPQGVTSKSIPKWIHFVMHYPHYLNHSNTYSGETFFRMPAAGLEFTSFFAEKPDTLSTKFTNDIVPNLCFEHEIDHEILGVSSRGNRSYCERPLCTGLTREQSSELYACRSYTSIQLSRFLQALRGSCKVVAPLFETNAMVQQFVVAVLSDVAGHLSRDAVKVREQLQVTEDIERISAHYACTLLFYSCVYGFSADTQTCFSVIGACVHRVCELIDQLRRSAATDKSEVSANWCSIHRLACIGIACFSFISEMHCRFLVDQHAMLEDVVTLVLVRHHATVMASGIPTRFFSCFDGEALLLLYRCVSKFHSNGIPVASIISRALSRIGCVVPAEKQRWKAFADSATFYCGPDNGTEEFFVDLYTGEVRVKGLPFGGLTATQRQSPAFCTLFSKENQLEVAPDTIGCVKSVSSFPQFLPAANETTRSATSDSGSAHFVFSPVGDVGLFVTCSSFELRCFFRTTPLSENIGVTQHYHFYGTYRVRQSDGTAWQSYRIVLFKPMPPRGQPSWFEWAEGMHLIDYVALQPEGDTPVAGFTVYAVPRSRKGDILAVLPSVLNDLEVVVLDVGVRQALADAFDCTEVDTNKMIVCVQNGTVSVELPLLHEKFTLSSNGLYTRQLYKVAPPGTTTSWLPPWRAGKKLHLALWRDEASLHTVPIAHALAAPKELVLWPVIRGEAKLPHVVEVSRHEHFGYLETNTDRDTLHLCLALLGEYPLHVPLFEDGLTTADVVCGLLARCATNVSFTEEELTVLLDVYTGVAKLPAGGGIVRVWLDALTQAREEMSLFYDHTRGAGETLLKLREELQRKLADTQNEYASYYVALVKRGLLPPRLSLPSELISFTRSLYTSPYVSASVRGLPNTPFALTPAMRRKAHAARSLPTIQIAELGKYAATLYQQREELMERVLCNVTTMTTPSTITPTPAAKATGIDVRSAVDVEVRLTNYTKSLQECKTALATMLPQFYKDLQLTPRVVTASTEHESLEEELLLLQVLHEAAPSAAFGTSLQEVAAVATGLQDAAALPGASMMRFSATYSEELRTLCVSYVTVCGCLGWCTRLSRLLTRAVEDVRKTKSKEAAKAAWQPFFLELSSPRSLIEQYVPWLVYEAEQNVSIRGVQYETWKLMSDRSQNAAAKTVTQLHMGEGKTRVVVPMLILSELQDAAQSREPRLPCVMALSAVSEELRQHLHRSLGTPGLRVRVLQKPFSRDVPFTEEALDRLLTSFNRFQRGAVVERREYFNSFTQKREELVELCRCNVEQLKQLALALPPPPARLFGKNALYILDEADELLSCRYNLIYSAGSLANLDQREQRWALIQHLLRLCAKAVHKFPGSFELFTLQRLGQTQEDTSATEGYPIFLLRQEAAFDNLSKWILSEFFANPPASFAWMTAARDIVERLVFADVTTESSCLATRHFTRDMIAQIMCLRGFFRLGLLRFVLSQRFNVTFGLAPQRRTRMAVPYMAADVPSRRNEFAQPDVAATLTFVSYLVTGLDYERFREALMLLAQLPVSQRASEYERWINGVSGNFPLSAEMIDLQNTSEVRYLWSCLRYNEAVIGYWVKRAVLEKEGRYHNHMLRSTAWDLADQPRVVGFSGTKDACQLMPSGVRFEENADTRISGSTERASQLMPLHTKEKLQRLSAFAKEVSLWHSTAAFGAPTQAHTYIRAAVQLGCNVLVDLGALLAGLSLEVVASYLCAVFEEKRLTATFLGVCFFDGDRERWTVMDARTRTVEALTQSHIKAADCFVVYDQARCRGADLRLRANAYALVSLARETQRDDLLQAVGRLRAFGRGQTVSFIAPDSVVDAIQKVSTSGGGGGSSSTVPGSVWNTADADCKRILQWAVANTTHATLESVFDFIDAASHFYFKRSSWKLIAEGKDRRTKASFFVVAAPTDASSLYGRTAVPVKVKDYAVRMLLTTQRIDADLRNKECMQTYKHIESLFGETALQQADASTLVMEREVEQEKEVEQEVEVEELVYTPLTEVAVNMAKKLDIQSNLISFSTWCETAVGLPLQTPSIFKVYFSTFFDKIVKGDETGAGGVPPAKGKGSGVQTRVLRRISYILLRDITTAIFLTEFQADILIRDPDIEVVHSPTTLSFLIPAALVRGVKPESIVNSEGCRRLQVLASFFNGETYYTAEQCPLLLDIIQPALAKVRQSNAVAPSNTRTGGSDFFDEINLFYFLHCRKLYNMLPDSMLAELCNKELHEEVLRMAVTNPVPAAQPPRISGFVEPLGI